jgi:membrane protease YdiL (CAAX protease family)
LLFRGALLGWLTRYLPVGASIVVTALLFAVEHVYLVVMPIGLLFALALTAAAHGVTAYPAVPKEMNEGEEVDR